MWKTFKSDWAVTGQEKSERKFLSLGVISKVRTSRTNERTFIWHFTLSLPPQTKVSSTMGNLYGRWLCTLSSFFVATCPPNVVCLTQGRFPEDSIAKCTRRKSRTVKQKYDSCFFSTFFPFLHARKREAGVDLQCRTGASACHCLFSVFNLAFKSNRYLRWIDCSHIACISRLFSWTSSRLRNDSRHFMRFTLICKRRSAIGRRSCFIFFFTVDRTTNRVQTPSLPYESSFVCPRRANFWDDPLRKEEKKPLSSRRKPQTACAVTSGYPDAPFTRLQRAPGHPDDPPLKSFSNSSG